MSDGLPITAFALTNCLGSSVSDVLRGLAASESGLCSPLLRLPFPVTCGLVADDALAPLPPSVTDATRLERIILSALRPVVPLAQQAVSRWGGPRIGLVLATTTAWYQEDGLFGHTGTAPASNPIDRLLGLVRQVTGAEGPGYVVSAACASSAKALGSAKRLIDAGAADAVIVGGADALCATTLRGFHALGVLSSKPCRPFGAQRDGINLGEGACVVLVERAGDGLALLLGVGESSDAYHLTAPDPAGQGAERAMRASLVEAGVDPSQVTHINAHATATRYGDRAEAVAIRAVFPDSVPPVVATKAYTGHLLGAAGVTEVAMSILMLRDGMLPTSLGSDPVDPDIRLNIVTVPCASAQRIALSNSFGFGGANASVVVGVP